jgi:CheY-like chemotaxis protein
MRIIRGRRQKDQVPANHSSRGGYYGCPHWVTCQRAGISTALSLLIGLCFLSPTYSTCLAPVLLVPVVSLESRRKRRGGQALLRVKELRTVLIVGDDNTSRKQLRALFGNGSGFDACVEAHNGVEALDKAKSLSPNLVVLDFLLPDMSGLELAEKLKANILGLPILMLTTDYSVNIEKTALSYGVSAVFSKLGKLRTLVANARAVCGIK